MIVPLRTSHHPIMIQHTSTIASSNVSSTMQNYLSEEEEELDCTTSGMVNVLEI